MVPRVDRRARAVSAAGICAAAATLNILQVALPEGPSVDPVPGLGALVLTVALLLGGQRMPARLLLLFGPAGTVLIATAVASTQTYSDSAVLYLWPAVWVAYFYGRGATVMIVVVTAVAHGVALLTLPPGISSIDRWLDVTVVVAVIAAVVQWIATRNARLAVRLAEEARIDKLTGLLNRRGFDERLENEVVRSARYERPLSAVVFDIDHFKTVNDRHGHEVGDRVLACFGALLSSNARAVDVCGRMGGEEFVVLLPETPAAEAAEFAERVRASVARGVVGDGCGLPRRLDWTVSAGVACGSTAESLEVLIAVADDALYRAKKMGRDRVVSVPCLPAAA